MNRMTTTRSSKQAPLNSGTLSPNPWDLSLSGQNADAKLGGTRTEGRAPQGCDLSAVPSAEMATGGLDAEATQTPKQRPVQTLAYCGQKMVLTMGSTLPFERTAAMICDLRFLETVPATFRAISLLPELLQDCALRGLCPRTRAAGPQSSELATGLACRHRRVPTVRRFRPGIRAVF